MGKKALCTEAQRTQRRDGWGRGNGVNGVNGMNRVTGPGNWPNGQTTLKRILGALPNGRSRRGGQAVDAQGCGPLPDGHGSADAGMRLSKNGTPGVAPDGETVIARGKYARCVAMQEETGGVTRSCAHDMEMSTKPRHCAPEEGTAQQHTAEFGR